MVDISNDSSLPYLLNLIFLTNLYVIERSPLPIHIHPQKGAIDLIAQEIYIDLLQRLY